MSKYIASLNKSVEGSVTFESTVVLTGEKIGEYQVPMKWEAGNRQFETKKRALAWVEQFNKEHGEGTATYIGKQ